MASLGKSAYFIEMQRGLILLSLSVLALTARTLGGAPARAQAVVSSGESFVDLRLIVGIDHVADMEIAVADMADDGRKQA